MLWIHVETINRKIQNEYNLSEKLFNGLKKGYYNKDKEFIPNFTKKIFRQVSILF